MFPGFPKGPGSRGTCRVRGAIGRAARVALCAGACASCTVELASDARSTTGASSTQTTTATGGVGGSGGADPTPVAAACPGVDPGGTCVDAGTLRVCAATDARDVVPSPVDIACPPDTVCESVDGAAACRPTHACQEGEVQCAGAGALETCVGGAWHSTPCGAGVECRLDPGELPACKAGVSDPVGITIRGHLDYELRVPNASYTDFTSYTVTAPGYDFLVMTYDDAGVTGFGLTSHAADAGSWTVSPTRAPTPKTRVAFYAMYVPDLQHPKIGVGDPGAVAPKVEYLVKADTFWGWTFPVCASAAACKGASVNAGNQVVTEADGSGAAHIYQWAVYNWQVLRQRFPQREPAPLALYWAPGVRFGCGACFLPPYVPYRIAGTPFQTGVVLSNDAGTPTEWAASVINHELGHWIMQSLSRTPNEAAQHWFGMVAPPGMAYSEGWATAWGQAVMSDGPANPNPVFFDKQYGTSFWLDLSKDSLSSGAVPSPNPNGPLDQPLSEAIVAQAIWSLWASTRAVKPQALGVPVMNAIASTRLTSGLNRGYKTVDLIDFLDAVRCENAASNSHVDAVTSALKLPKAGAKLCK